MPDVDIGEASVRIVRMKTGQDILCGYLSVDEHVILENPLQLHMRKTERGMVMVLVPWLPIELVQSNIVVIDSTDILLTMEPKSSLTIYYNNFISKIEELISEDNEFISKDVFADSLESDEDDDYEMALKPSKTNLVH